MFKNEDILMNFTFNEGFVGGRPEDQVCDNWKTWTGLRPGLSGESESEGEDCRCHGRNVTGAENVI